MECLIGFGIALAGTAVYYHLQSKQRRTVALYEALEDATRISITLNESEPYVSFEVDLETMSGKQQIHEWGHEPKRYTVRRRDSGAWRRRHTQETRGRLLKERAQEWASDRPRLMDRHGETAEEDLTHFKVELGKWERMDQDVEDELESAWQRRRELLGVLLPG